MVLKKFSLIAVALFSTVAALAQNTPMVVQDGISGVADFKVIKIAIDADDPQVATLARRAFGAHGAYRIDNSAPTKVRFSKTSEKTIALACTLPGAQATQNVSGADWRDATLRACDAAVVLTGKSQSLRPLFTGKIAFVSDRTGKKEIYASDLFLYAVRPLTNLGSVSITPHWTHDGSEVLFTTYKNNNFTDIYAVNVASGSLRDVVVGVRGTSVGAVSNPKNGRIAFSSSSRGNMDVYVADSSGKGARAIVKTDDVDTDPTWSADGASLVVVSGASGRPSLYSASPDGGSLARIPTPGYPYATEPSCNPIFPQKIAFTYQQGGGFGIAVIDTSTREIKLASKGGSYMHSTWCADGRHLVATRIAGKASNLVLLDSETGTATPLSDAQMGSCSEADYLAVP